MLHTYALLICDTQADGTVTANVYGESFPELGSTWSASKHGIWDADTGALVNLDRISDQADDHYVVTLMPELARVSQDDRGGVKTPLPTGQPLPSFKPGDLIVAQGIGCPAPNGGAGDGLHLCGTPQIIKSGVDAGDLETARTAIVAHMAAADHLSKVFRESLGNSGFIGFEASAVRAGQQPNTVLLLTWKGDTGGLESGIIESTGAMMFWERYSNGDSETQCLPETEAPGLWLMRKGETWSETDRETGMTDSWGLDGTWEPIDLASAARHFGTTEEALTLRMDEIYPYHRDDRAILAMIAEDPIDPDALNCFVKP